MSAPKPSDILFRTGGTWLLGAGRPFIGYRRDGSVPETYTHTRADSTTCATYTDQEGRVARAAANTLRASWYDTASAGTWDACGFLIESARTNLCLQSEDFATTWADVGTPTLTPAALSCGVVSLALLGDDDGAASEGKRQTGIVATSTAVKAFSVFVSKGTSAAAGGSSLLVVDTTAGQNRLDGTLTWSGSVPSMAMTTGTLLRTVRHNSNIYRLEFQTASCTSGNSHRIDIFPAGTAAQTGNLYVGGVSFEEAAFPSSYIKTTTAAVTRAADSLTFPIGFATDDDLTVYAKVIRTEYNGSGGAQIPILIGGPGTPEAYIAFSGANLHAYLTDGSGTADASQTIPAGTTIEACAQFANFSTTPTAKIDVGSGFGSAATGPGAITTWATQMIAPGYGSVVHIVDLIVARGLFTLAEMQACPTPS